MVILCDISTGESLVIVGGGGGGRSMEGGSVTVKLMLNIYISSYCKQIRYTFSMCCEISRSNTCNDADILRQMRMLCCRFNRLVRLFNKCSKPVLHELCRSFCTVGLFYCPYFWAIYKKTTFSKIRVSLTTSIGRSWVCLDVLRLVLCLSLTTFLSLKLFYESHLPLEYHFPVTM